MPPAIPPGPYRTLRTKDGVDFPYYVIPFDKDGRCEGPQTQQHLLDNLQGVTDVFLFSHGWNNDWTVATKRYEHFINGVQRTIQEQQLARPVGYRPLLVGIFWPSQAMTWFGSERGPDFAGHDDRGQGVDDELAVLRDVAAALPEADRDQFYTLAGASELDDAEAQALASILSRATTGDSEAGPESAPEAADLLSAAEALAGPPEDDEDYETVGTVSRAARDANPRAAGGGLGRKLDPRNLVKPFTVWQMKDRAGRIGATGVSRLLRALLDAEPRSARVHLIGHSFGCKVVMTAVSVTPPLSRPVESALLLQPAVSQYAFAAAVPDRGVPGGFHVALSRVRLPIHATFSSNDSALSKHFHLALRRASDVGELQFAGSSTPTRYGALGGFGPQPRAHSVAIMDAPQTYDLSGFGSVVGVEGTRTIANHGDISNPSTWWLLCSLAHGHLTHPTRQP